MVLVWMFVGRKSLRRLKRLSLNQFLQRWMSLGDWSEKVPVIVTLTIHSIIKGIIKEVEVEYIAVAVAVAAAAVAAAVGLLLIAGGEVHGGEEGSEAVLGGTSNCAVSALFCLVGCLMLT